MHIKTKVAAGVGGAVFALLGMSGTAAADHAHFVVIENPATGETTCQYFGSGQTEIPDGEGHGGAHKIHDNVHRGQPGTDLHGTSFDRDDNEARYECATVRRRPS